jgi:hypothetical protein
LRTSSTPSAGAGAVVGVAEAGGEAVLVAVAAGDAERVAGVLHARAGHRPLVHGLAERHVGEGGRAHVADAREAGHERAPRVLHAEDRAVAGVVAHRGVVVARVAELAADDVDVARRRSPGSSVASPRSMTRAPAGTLTRAAGPAAVMRSP